MLKSMNLSNLNSIVLKRQALSSIIIQLNNNNNNVNQTLDLVQSIIKDAALFSLHGDMNNALSSVLFDVLNKAATILRSSNILNIPNDLIYVSVKQYPFVTHSNINSQNVNSTGI
eukprot:TRINITY_DN33071_c0_g1_i1.p1 TRINITY_DN33071_c0_g1~~TRINITY_DN33071_c0_g1_i1.p1  ORF type:complete len:115 (+),score=11.77 TRINITY_DN33071_c0_g1_i1:229-573(+)